MLSVGSSLLGPLLLGRGSAQLPPQGTGLGQQRGLGGVGAGGGCSMQCSLLHLSGVGVASQAKVKVLTEQHNARICNSCSVCPCSL